MDHRRQFVSPPLDSEPAVASALSDDEAFAALAASMTLFDSTPASSDDDEVARCSPPPVIAQDASSWAVGIPAAGSGTTIRPLTENLEQCRFALTDDDGHLDVPVDADNCSDDETDDCPNDDDCSDDDVAAPVAELAAPLPAALTEFSPAGDLPELLPLDGGNAMVLGQGWLDPMAFNPRPTADTTVDQAIDQTVMLGQFTAEHSSESIAAAQPTGGVATVSPAEAPDWWRPRTMDDFAAMLDGYLSPVCAVVAGLSQRPGLLDEVVVKTFLSAWVEGRHGTPSGPLEPWLYSLCVEAVRWRERRHQRLGSTATSRYPAPAHRGSENSRLSQARQLWELRLAIEEMDTLERTVLRLAHQQGLDHNEIAENTESPLGEVRSCLYRSSSHLIGRLKDRLDAGGVDGLDDGAEPALDAHDWNLDELVGSDARSALAWHLAGVADDSQLSANDRQVVNELQTLLAGSAVWTEPTAGLRDVIVSAAVNDEATLMIRSATDQSSGVDDIEGLARTTVQYSPTVTQDRPRSRRKRVRHPTKAGRVKRPSSGESAPPTRVVVSPTPPSKRQSAQSRSTESTLVPHGQVAALAIGVIVLAAAIILAPHFLRASTDDDVTLDYELAPTAAAPDARAVVSVTQLGAEALYRLSFGGLGASAEQQYYAAWLIDPDTAVDGVVSTANAKVLGSFRWTANGDPIVLSVDNPDPRFDHLVITLQGPNDPPGPSGVLIMEGTIFSLGS